MGLLSMLRRGGSVVEKHEAPTVETCVHGVRVPRWEAIADMGHDDRASHFVCESCGRRFTPEQSAALPSAREVLGDS